MRATTLFRAMARNNAYANRRLGTAMAALTEDDFAAPRTGFFPSLQATANHILEVDLYYVDALTEGGRGTAVFERFTPFSHVAALYRLQQEVDGRLVAFTDALTDYDLARRVVTDRGPLGRVPERVDALLLHLVQHQIHHRGQLHAMLSGTSVAPPQLDEWFLDFDAAARREDEEALGYSGGSSPVRDRR